jgi:hypothetical protein
MGDDTVGVDPHGDGIDVDKGNLVTHHGDFFRR